MATINTEELFSGVKEFLEKIGCTNVRMEDVKMKTVYVIKVHSVAKPNNKAFSGEEAFYYYGKKGQLLKAIGSHIENDRFYRWPREYTVYGLEEYGYKRYCDACRVAKTMKKWADEHNDRDDYYWSETITIIAETIPE